MISPTATSEFLRVFDARRASGEDSADLAMRMLAETFPHCRWVGIYWLDADMLVLGPYVGAPTDHVRIPVGRGVCGTAIAEGKNQIVPDVRQVENYLACSLKSRAEIVVLIRRAGEVVGQIDADSDDVGAFDSSDEELLTAVAERLAR